MALTLNDYTLRVDGSGERATSGDIAVGASNHGLIVAGAFAVDARLAGINIQEFTTALPRPNPPPPPPTPPPRAPRIVDPWIPFIDARNALTSYIFSTDTAVPYNLQRLLSGTQRLIGNTVRATVITAVFPAIVARVALFNVMGPPGTLAPIIRAKSLREDGADALEKFLVRSYDPNFTLGTDDRLLSLTYKVSNKQPFIMVGSNQTQVVFEDVTKDDIIVIAASDTSPNAATAGITVGPGVTLQNLLSPADARHSRTLTNPQNNEVFTVGSVMRVDRLKSAGTYEATLIDVTGSCQAIRLTPSFEVVTTPATQYVEPEILPDNLAYFKVMVERTGRMVNVYPRWLLNLMAALAPSENLGMMANWPMQVLETDPETGQPTLWNELQLWAIPRANVTGAFIPFGEAYVYPTRAEMAAEWLLLDKQL